MGNPKKKIMKNNLLTALYITSILFISTNTFSQNREQVYDSLLTTLFASNGPGGTALVVKNGDIVYNKAFGKANLELDVPMQTNNIFRVGSITKQFTACAILKLVEQEKLSLNDDITKYIEDYPTFGYKITIEHLLTHTSGIKSFTSLKAWDTKMRKNNITPIEMIDFFKNEPMDFAPGEQFSYNNSGFYMLGYIIEQITGMTYGAYLNNSFFKPLGMTNTSIDNAERIITNRVSGYEKVDNQYLNADYINMSQVYSAGSLISTTEDILIWYNALINKDVINKESLKKAHTSFVLNSGEKTGNGYGWFLGNIQGSPMIEHGGGINGFLTSSLYLPEENVFVAIFSNCDCNPTGITAFKMAAIAINKPYKRNKIQLTNVELSTFEANYKTENKDQITIVLENDKLFYISNDERLEIQPYGKDNFFVDDSFTTLHFKRDNSSVITSVTVKGIQYPIIYKRIN